jgi:hypothetical protein
VKGDFHARFLGGGAAVTPLPYPTAAHYERSATEIRWLVFERFGAKPRHGLVLPLGCDTKLCK